MQTLIDFGDKSTWPSQLQSLVFKNSDVIAEEKKADWENILSGKAHYHFIDMPTYDKVKSGIEEFLLESTALAWHCTKLIDPEKIKKEGLKPFSVEILKGVIKNDLGKYINSEDQKIIIKKIDEFEEKRRFQNRKNQIWFLLNKEMMSESGCQEFFEFFGGEALRRVIECELPECIPVFRSVGEPYLIEFPVNLCDIESFQISFLAEQLIDFGICLLKGDERPCVKAEGKIEGNLIIKDNLNHIPFKKH